MFLFRKKRNNSLELKNTKIFTESISDIDNESYSSLKQKTRTKNLFFILKLLISLNILIIAVIAYLYYLNTENNRNFNKIIFQADRSLSAGDYETAGDFLDSAISYSNTKKNVLILLKRYYKVASYLNNYSEFKHNAEIFYKSYKHDSRIKKIYLFSLLKNNEIEIFFKYFHYNSDDTFLNNMLLEGYSAYLRGNYNFQVKSKISDILKSNIYFNLLKEKTNIDSYVKSYELERNKAFLNNLILLYMKKGLPREALKYNLIRDKKDYLSSLIIFDNNKYEESLEIISNIPDKDTNKKLIMADLEMSLSNRKKGLVLYKNIYDSDPMYSNIPLMNLIWLEYNEKGYINNNYLADLLKSYSSDNLKNLLFFINLQKIYKESDNDNLLNNYNNLDELFSLNRNNQSKYLDIIWSLYNNYNVDDEFKKYFLYYLVDTDRYKDLLILLDKEEIRNSSYYFLFKSFYEIKTGNYSNAEKKLTEYVDKNNCWEIFYNIGLINIKKENYSDALKYFDIALNKSIISDNDASSVFFWKAYSLYRMNNFRAADRTINKSILKNRSNIEAKFLRNHIKSKIVES